MKMSGMASRMIAALGSRTSSRRSFFASVQTAIFRLSLAQSVSRQVQEHSLQVGFLRYQAGQVNTGRVECRDHFDQTDLHVVAFQFHLAPVPLVKVVPR